jgi:hypothetical protein
MPHWKVDIARRHRFPHASLERRHRVAIRRNRPGPPPYFSGLVLGALARLGAIFVAVAEHDDARYLKFRLSTPQQLELG